MSESEILSAISEATGVMVWVPVTHNDGWYFEITKREATFRVKEILKSSDGTKPNMLRVRIDQADGVLYFA